MSDDSTYNRVLIEESAFFRPYKTKYGARGMFADGSSLPFILEELVAYSARQIAVAPTNLSGFVDGLSEGWRSKVANVDSDGKIASGLLKLFEPIGSEFGIELNLGEAVMKKQTGFEELQQHALGAFALLYPFLIGLKCQLQIDVDIHGLIDLLGKVRNGLHDQETRRKLATLEGALRFYSPIVVPGLKSSVSETSEIADILDKLLDDELYKALSGDAHKIGFPARLRQTRDGMLRKARAIVRKPIFKGIYEVGTIGLKTATQISTPDNDAVQSLLGAKYLPPIIDLKPAISRARAAWMAEKPEPIPPSKIEIGELLDFEDATI